MKPNPSWRDGGFKIFFDSGTCLWLRTDQQQQFVTDWMNGNAFGEYIGLYENKIFIKLGKVHGAMIVTSESVEMEAADDKHDKELEKAENLLGDG